MSEYTRNAYARSSSAPYWLAVRHRLSQMQVHTSGEGGQGPILPVFSSEQAARVFLRRDLAESGWTPRQTSAGELVSVLYGPCAHVRRVAVDPSPETAALPSGHTLISLDRRSFLDSLLGRGRSWFDDDYRRERMRTPTLVS